MTSMQAHYATLASIRQGIFVVQADPPDYPITFVNAALSAATGYDAEELLGRSCAILFGAPDDTRLAREQLAAALQPPQETTERQAPETKLPRLLSVSEVCDSDQRYYIALVEGRASQAAAPLDIGHVAHQLRAPLSACVAWIELLQLKENGSPEIAAAVAAIKRNLERQSRMIDDLVEKFAPGQ
jgi:PAS domain S-box-containing protein